MINRTSTIKRTRRTKAQVEQLDCQIVEALKDDHPQSVRHVFYRMTDPRLPEPVEKSERGYRQLQNRVKILRRDGRIPYGWISDSTRTGYHVDTFTSAADFIRSHARYYRADIWQDSEYHVEVWTESRSIAGVLLDTCQDLAVSLYPCGGFTSISLAYQAAENINWIHQRTGRTPVVIYVGDYDPAGVIIDKSLKAELQEHLDCELGFVRLAVTESQITRFDLPTRPRKKSDRRSKHIKYAVEAEALPAHILRAMVRANVEAYLPSHALEVMRVAEESEQSFLLDLAEQIERGSQHREA